MKIAIAFFGASLILLGIAGCGVWLLGFVSVHGFWQNIFWWVLALACIGMGGNVIEAALN
jgi:hypothetical protein